MHILKKFLLEKKFGNLGKIGAAGEDKAYDILQNVFYEVIDDRKNPEAQINGWDFRVRQSSWKFFIKIEVKTNLYFDKDGFKFPVELEKYGKVGDFLKSSAHRFLHLSKKTGDYLYYDLPELRNFVNRKLNLPDNWIHNLIREAPGGDNAKLLWISTNDDRFKEFLNIFRSNK